MLAGQMVDAIWRDDVDAVRALVLKHPRLLHEMARGTKDCNWGPPHRTFSLDEIYPECGGYDANGNHLGIHGTPLEGASLLHLCVDQDEPELLSWLLDRGADANAKAAIDSEGFGGHTPIFVRRHGSGDASGRTTRPPAAGSRCGP